MRIIDWTTLDQVTRDRALTRPALCDSSAVSGRVREIISRVRSDGDAALIALTQEIDGVKLSELEVSSAEWGAAQHTLNEDQRRAIAVAARNIAKFHRAQLPSPIDLDTTPGVRCQRVYRPLKSVGLYVPAGTAPLPSTALMLGIPADIAGCSSRILCSPPRADGSVDAAVLYAAQIANVDRVFKLGGAQAIAAMAYGTETVPKTDKLFGPGNTWVTEAKAQADRDPGGAARDFAAGPSEVLIIADGNADAEFVATDLLSQAEHGPDSQVLLLTDSPELARSVALVVERIAPTLPRREIIAASLEHSLIIVLESIFEAIKLANRYAPEHLILQTESPRDWLPQIDAAGSVFLGRWAPESIGDYCSGTNHVLPTYGYARTESSLGVADFLRSMTVQELSIEGIAALGPTAETLARLEGLDAHALAVTTRLDRIKAEAKP